MWMWYYDCCTATAVTVGRSGRDRRRLVVPGWCLDGSWRETTRWLETNHRLHENVRKWSKRIKRNMKAWRSHDKIEQADHADKTEAKT